MSLDLLILGTIIEFKDKLPFWRAIVRQVYPGEVLLGDVCSAASIKSSKDFILERIAVGEAKFLLCSTSFNDITYKDLMVDEQAEVCRGLRYIEYLAERHYKSVTPKAIAAIEKCAETISDTPPHWQSVRTWFKKYFENGKSLKFLFPRHRFKGRRESRIQTEVIEIIDKEARRYFSQSQPSLASIYRNITTSVIAHNLINPSNALDIPVYNTVKARILAETYERKKKAREGKKSFQNQMTGDVPVITTTSILERVEVDHTKLDIYLLHDEHNTLIGRPSLTVLIDHYSGMLLGFLLSFEPGSFAAVCAACKNAFLPKPTYEEYDVKSSWPAHGIPENIITDNGNEFWGENFIALAGELSTNFQYCPIRTPNYKGCVERFFGTIKSMVLDDMPGVVRKPDESGEDYDAKKEAKVNFKEFKAYLTKWVIDEYHHLPRSESSATPFELWVESEELFPVPVESELDLLPKIMGTGNKKNRKGGVHIYGLSYESLVLKDFRRRDGDKDVRVKYDPFDIGYILTFDDVSNTYIKVLCTNFDYANGLSLYEHRLIKAELRKLKKLKIEDIDTIFYCAG